ncbi:MAG: hypothetical protein U5N56_03745 [Candidatus Marinimicrobia bacterium]|nr:hypothetical protein [Candidatus Neomarinimicrobiota bacterium]
MKRKKGKTKSVGVQPCHAACFNGGYMAPQVPGLFTSIISAIVAPLKTSSAISRFVSVIVFPVS